MKSKLFVLSSTLICTCSAISAFATALPSCLTIAKGSCCQALEYDQYIPPVQCVSCAVTGCCSQILTDYKRKVPIPLPSGSPPGSGSTSAKQDTSTGNNELCTWKSPLCNESGICVLQSGFAYAGCYDWFTNGNPCP